MITGKSKQAALLNARERSKQGIRRTSQSSTANPQSEVTKKPPQLYRLEKMNVPDTMEAMTRMVHAELQKIETSQSTILSLWQQMQEMSGTVETVNGNAPDDSGNVQIDTGVMSVNGVEPDASGNVQVDSGGVTSVNGQEPDDTGNVAVNVGVLTVNGNAPDADGDITITYDPAENYALIEGIALTGGAGQKVSNPFGSGVPCHVQIDVSIDGGETWKNTAWIEDANDHGWGTHAAWVMDDIYITCGTYLVNNVSLASGTVPFESGSGAPTTGVARIHCWR